MRTHATLPVVDQLDEETLRVYFACRDDENRSRIAGIDLAASDPLRVLRTIPEPLLPLGQRGTFDDNGMTPCCIVADGQLRYLYYIGWNPQVAVSYRLAIGLAVSEDGGHTYRGYSPGPLLDRDRDEPFFNTTPCVVLDRDRWRMWYSSCTGWTEVDGRAEPMYHVKYAESEDGIRWKRTGTVCIDYDTSTQAIARPWVVRFGKHYVMWFSYRGIADYRTDPRTSYRIGLAESRDGLHWDRKPDPAGLERSTEGWDSIMMAYTCILSVRDSWLCFYNGNGFGHSGFGYAVAE
jgi:hypothetical protein